MVSESPNTGIFASADSYVVSHQLRITLRSSKDLSSLLPSFHFHEISADYSGVLFAGLPVLISRNLLKRISDSLPRMPTLLPRRQSGLGVTAKVSRPCGYALCSRLRRGRDISHRLGEAGTVVTRCWNFRRA